MTPKITVVCGGVFTSHRLAEQLYKRGALDKLVTSYPPRRGEVVPRNLIRWNPLPELLMRSGLPNGHYLKALTFGRWAARHVWGGNLLICWAQFGLESIRKAKVLGIPTVLVRQSTHILNQIAVLRLPRTPLVERELAEYQETDRIEIPSQQVKRTFLDYGVPEEKLVLVQPVGIDPGIFHPPAKPPKEFRAITVGVSRRKGTRIACEAATMAGVPLWVVGRPDAPIRPFKERFGASVTFLGPVSQKRLGEMYRQSSVAIIASAEEGLAHSLVEAVASGLPVIASLESGAKDVIKHTREGWFVIPTDYEMIAEYLARLRANALLRAKMSAAAAETGKRWGWDQYGERAVKAYATVLEGGGRGLPLHSPPNPP